MANMFQDFKSDSEVGNVLTEVSSTVKHIFKNELRN